LVILLERIVEPELMDEPEQALAYHNADFSTPHGRRVVIFQETFPDFVLTGNVLDLGCGSGDVLFRFARALPNARFVGVDGSCAMLHLAQGVANSDAYLSHRVSFVEGIIPGAEIPDLPYDLVMSHSLLHHLHEPHVLWETVKTYARPGSHVFVADLRRPDSARDAHSIMNELSGGEPEVLRRDFYNSLCAAFTPEEIADQLQAAGLAELNIAPIGEIHVIVSGIRG
jgi:SAM-dependent methyltransferase